MASSTIMSSHTFLFETLLSKQNFLRQLLYHGSLFQGTTIWTINVL
jgi:hypothetical protein